MKQIIVLFFVFASSVVFSQEEKVNIPKIFNKVSLGELLQLDNVSIKFIEVLEDSRCPKEVTCIWMGRARVLVEISENEKSPQQKTLILGQIKQGESKNKILFSGEEMIIKGVMLSPYPTLEIKGNKDTYALLIDVDKL